MAKKTKKEDDHKKTKKSKKTKELDAGKAMWQPDYAGIMDEVEMDYKLGKIILSKEARRMSSFSTGVLVTDLILDNGGLVPGSWVTMFGPEQSAKSTNCSKVMISAANSEIPLVALFDFEGSSDPNYIENFHGNKLDTQHLFGLRDVKTGKWVIRPRVRYYAEDVAETFFDSVKALLNRLPDKLFLDGQWWYHYENTKEGRKIFGDKYDKKMYQKYKGYYIPAPNAAMQALVIVDSYPAMLPKGMDERDEGGGGVSEQARMFSNEVKKLKAKLRRKAVTIMGVNQLRQRPMSMGNPEYEPGGEALKFYSDVRIRFSPRSLSTMGRKGKGILEEEKSVQFDGYDTYRFIHARAIKNKLGQPYLEGTIRLWTRDPEGKAHGIDPVWDAFQYGLMTGQITKLNKSRVALVINGSSIKFPKAMDWLDFKGLILLHGDELKKLCKKLKIEKNPRIFKSFQDQLKSGLAQELFFKTMREGGSDDDDGDDD